jgi:IS5 family transposase
MATADRGFYSAKNERQGQALGVKKRALRARGRLSAKRAEPQKQRWFRRGLRWRAGMEATISTLKHPFSMWRAPYKGRAGPRGLRGLVCSSLSSASKGSWPGRLRGLLNDANC